MERDNKNKLVFAQNSIRNKFDLLGKPVEDNIYVLMISETKIDDSCPIANFVKIVLTPHIDLIVMQMVVKSCWTHFWKDFTSN